MTASTDIEKINKWIWGNGKKGADQSITEHNKDIESIKEDLKCKADVVMVQNISNQIAEMKKTNDRIYNAAITIAVGMAVYFLTQVVPGLLKLIN